MNNEAKQGGVTSRVGLYAYASKYSKEAIDCLYQLMQHSGNEGIKMGAAKALLSKSLPDIQNVPVGESLLEFREGVEVRHLLPTF